MQLLIVLVIILLAAGAAYYFFFMKKGGGGAVLADKEEDMAGSMEQEKKDFGADPGAADSGDANFGTGAGGNMGADEKEDDQLM